MFVVFRSLVNYFLAYLFGVFYLSTLCFNTLRHILVYCFLFNDEHFSVSVSAFHVLQPLITLAPKFESVRSY